MTAISKIGSIKRGHGSPERQLAGELWALDTYPDFAARTDEGNYDPTYDKIDYRRYYDRDYARHEHENVWMKSWILVCREEDLPEVGDRQPISVGPVSFFVIRTEADSFKAFFNSCTHRGTQLCSAPESGTGIRCPFHAWEWKIDGTLSYIPSHWDFKMVNPKNGSLREIRVGRWGGFVYINADPEAPELLDALGIIPKHFATFELHNRYTAGHFRKLVRANWKLSQEAFMESYHVIGTHSNAIAFSGDTQAQYDIFEDGAGHIGRQLTPGGHPSMHAPPEASVANAILGAAQFLRDMHYPDEELPEIDPSRPVRPQVAAWFRDLETARLGRTCTFPDGIMLDSPLYFVFPQSCFWLSEALPFVYSFLPHDSDPELSYMEVRMMKLFPEGTERPKSAPRIEVAPDQNVADEAKAFGFLGNVFDQDYENLPLVQAGVRSADPARHYAQLGEYQEFVIKRFHELLDEAMSEK